MAQEGSIAKAVRAYIDRRPVVRDALAMGIVNLSALTRQIQDDLGVSKEEAVLVACRRYNPRTEAEGYEAGIRRVLDRSKLEVRTRVGVWTLRASWRLFSRLEKVLPNIQGQATPVHLLHGSEALTVIADEAMASSIEGAVEAEDILNRQMGLVEVNLRTPEAVEEVPGILAFLTSSLAARGINFVEVISCHKDNMFVIDEADLMDAFQVLNALIRP